MAKFNQDLPGTQDPSYIGLSRGTSGANIDTSPAGFPKVDAPNTPDVSTGTLLKNIGNIAETAVKGYDTYVKADIDEKTYEQVDAVRDQYTKQLRDQLKMGASAGAVTAGVSDDEALVDSDEITGQRRKMPRELEDLPRTAESMKNARESGTLMSLDYTARVTKLAKEMRAKYPGYREYIDQTFSQASGMTIANAEFRSLAAAVRAQQATDIAEKKGVNAMLMWAIKQGIPEASIMKDLYDNNRIDGATVYKRVGSHQEQRARQKELEDDYKLTGVIRSERKANQEIIVRDAISSEVGNSFHTLEMVSGATAGMKFTELADKAARGELKVDPADARQLAGQIMAMKAAAANRIMQNIEQRGLSSGMDRAELRKQLDAGLSVYDTAADYITNDKWGPLNHAVNRVKDQIDTTKRELFANKDFAETMIMQRTLNENGGQAVMGKFYESIMPSDITPRLKTFLQDRYLKAATQPNLKTDPGGYSLDQMLKEAKENGATSSKTFQQFNDFAEKFSDAKLDPKTRFNMAVATYGDNNQKYLRNFENDAEDPMRPGYRVKGKYAVYQQLTSDKMAKSVVEIAKATNRPELLDMQRKWTENSLDSLFKPEMQELVKVPKIPGVDVSWDTENKRFGLWLKKPDGQRVDVLATDIRKNNPMSTEFPIQLLNDAAVSMRRLNTGIKGYVNVANAQGLPVDAFVMDRLTRSGVDIYKTHEKEGFYAPVKIPDQLFRAIYQQRLLEHGTKMQNLQNKDLPASEENP